MKTPIVLGQFYNKGPIILKATLIKPYLVLFAAVANIYLVIYLCFVKEIDTETTRLSRFEREVTPHSISVPQRWQRLFSAQWRIRP